MGRTADLTRERSAVIHRPLTRLQKIDTSKLSERVRPRLKPRGLPPALEAHLIWSTDDPGAAQVFARDLFGMHALVVGDDRSDFHASYHAVRLREISVGHLDYTGRVRIDSRRLPPSVLVLVPMSGQATVVTSSPVGRPLGVVQANPIAAAVPRRNHPTIIDCDPQSPLLVVSIDDLALRVHLSRLLGRALPDPLEFEPTFHIGEPSASRWNFAIQILHAELFEHGSLLRSGVGIGQLEEFVMSSLLYAHTSNYSEFLNRPGQVVEHRVTRAAKDHIEQHLGEPLTVREIAFAVGVSERTLQSAFKAELATTPMTYVRDRRLQRARDELADAAAADNVSVTMIATRWGLGHLGRFAADYKARFGETPSQTLRA